jgi:NAD(P)H-dependent FMN reductase
MSALTRPALLLLGTHRLNSNGAGLASWVTGVWNQRLSARDPASSQAKLEPSRDILKNLPSDFEGPITDSDMPAAIDASEKYSSEPVRAWSKRVRDSSAVVIVTPEYNGSYPGGLKNAIDHLYFEWKAKPVLVVTYGGRGGLYVTEALKNLLGKGMKANLVDVINVPLPSEFMRTNKRVSVETPDEFLQDYQSKLSTAIDATLAAAEEQTDNSKAASL